MKLFIPYGGRDDWGEELRYTLRSLALFSPFELTIYATKLPNWLTVGEEVERFYPEGLEKKHKCRKYEHWFDSVNKLRKYVNTETQDRFVYTYDDIMLLKESSPDDIIHYYQEQITDKHKLIYSRYRHGETVLAAISNCNNSVCYSYETHTPRIYETEKIKWLFEKYPLEKQYIPYSIATLYFNHFPPEELKCIKDTDDYKAGFYGRPGKGNGYCPESVEEIDDIVLNKTWLNYSYAGLMFENSSGAPVLKTWIEQKYKTPSKYEGCIDNDKPSV